MFRDFYQLSSISGSKVMAKRPKFGKKYPKRFFSQILVIQLYRRHANINRINLY